MEGIMLFLCVFDMLRNFGVLDSIWCCEWRCEGIVWCYLVGYMLDFWLIWGDMGIVGGKG